MINIDTQILVHAVGNRLRPDERRILEGDSWCISDVMFWELGKLERARRIKMSLDDPDFNKILRRISVWPITREIGKIASRLDFVSDPADEIIAATSIAHDIPLLTRDTRILGSKIVPLALR